MSDNLDMPLNDSEMNDEVVNKDTGEIAPPSRNPEFKKRKEAIDGLVKDLNKTMFKGDPVIANMKDAPKAHREAVTTGSLVIDTITGIGGWPRGCQIEFSGPEGQGKSSLLMLAMVNAQKQGEFCFLVDNEGSLDPDYFASLGGDLEMLYTVQADTMEDQLEVVEQLSRSGHFGLGGIDSIANMAPEAELEGEYGEANMGVKARLMGQAMRRIQTVVNKSKLTIIWVNQERDTMKQDARGNVIKTTPGGKAVRYNCHMRVAVSSPYEKPDKVAALEKQYGEGMFIECKFIKTRFGKRYKSGKSYFIFGKGFAYLNDLMDAAVDNGVVETNGSWKRWFAADGSEFKWNNEVTFKSNLMAASPEHYLEFEAAVKNALYNS